MATASLADLVNILEELHLLEPHHWQALGSMDPRPREPRELIRILLTHGWITRFQAAKLLQQEHASLRQGPYVLLEPLGEGGMGQVYKARHARLGHIVALKIIHRERVADRKAVSRFQREMQAVGNLHHPNIIRAFDAGEANPGYYLAMEFVVGLDLSRLLRQLGRLPVHRACDYTRQAALGLQHAHERGLVHRDIKPSNLLLAVDTSPKPQAAVAAPFPDRTLVGGAEVERTVVTAPEGPPLSPDADPGPGVIKILDLGLARLERSPAGEVMSQVTCDNLLIGTPDYMAPEQAADPHAVDHRADIYSLGCTLYHLLTGRVPFVGQSLVDKLVKHKTEVAEPVSSLRPDVPPAVSALVSQMMAKDPDRRPASAAEVAQALAPYCTPAAMSAAAAVSVPDQDSREAPGQAAHGHKAVETPVMESDDCETAPATLEAGSEVSLARPRLQSRERRLGPLVVGLGVFATSLLVTGALVAALLFIARNSVGQTSSGGSSPVATPAPETVPATRTPDPNSLEREWLTLLSRTSRPTEDEVRLRQDLLAFAARNAQSPYGRKAVRSFLELPSVLDRHRTLSWSVSADRPPVIAILNGPGEGSSLPDRPPLAFSADGRLLAVAASDRVAIWNLEETPPQQESVLARQNRVLHKVAFSPDGKLLLTASGGGDRAVRLWRVQDGQEELRVGGWFRRAAGCGCISPDGRTLVVGGEGWLSVWKLPEVSAVRQIRYPKMGLVRALAFLPDSQRVLSVGQDAMLRLWDLGQESPVGEFGKHPAAVGDLAVTPDGRLAVTSCADHRLRFWEIGNGNLVGECDLAQPIAGASLSPEGQVVALVTSDGRLHLVGCPTGKILRTAAFPETVFIPCNVAFAPDGRHLALPGKEGKTLILRLER